MLKSYLCPSVDTAEGRFLQRDGLRYARTSYVAAFGPGTMSIDPGDRRGLFSRNCGTIFAEVIDSLSQTLAGGERHNGTFAVAAGPVEPCRLRGRQYRRLLTRPIPPRLKAMEELAASPSLTLSSCRFVGPLRPRGSTFARRPTVHAP